MRYINTIVSGLGLLILSSAASAASPHHIHIAVSHTGQAIKWYEENLQCTAIGGRTKAIECGGMEIEFLANATLGGSLGTGVNHIAFSYADVTAKMNELEEVGVRGSGVRLQRFPGGELVRDIAGAYKHAFVFDPWGTRIELVEDPASTGFHHIHLNSADPSATLDWYAEVLGGERADHYGTTGLRFDSVWVLVDGYDEGRPASTQERAIDHLGFSVAGLTAVAAGLRSQEIQVQGPEVPQGARNGEAQRAFMIGPDGVLIALVEPGWAGTDEVSLISGVAAADAENYVTPMTPWGEPDLQGMWTGNASHGIPLERPEEVATGELTADEAAARREEGTLNSIWGYEREWRDTTLGYVKSAPSTQVAMIVDPPDGRMPPMTDKGKTAVAAEAARFATTPLYGGPEELTNYVRCITRGLPDLMMPSIYNNGLQIAQSPGYVAVQKEMIHETRVIPISEREHLEVEQWLGNSRGRWEGDTLVVEVRGFNGREDYKGAGKDMKLTERFRRVGPSKLEYTFTVDDPTVWERPWTGMFHFDLDNEQYELVEYACHEGNYGMTNILSASRATEREQAEGKKDSSYSGGD